MIEDVGKQNLIYSILDSQKVIFALYEYSWTTEITWNVLNYNFFY